MDAMRTTLIPLKSARGRLIPQFGGKQVTSGTLSRWVHRGLAAANGERIRLQVVYVGRTPHVSAEMVDKFFKRVTAARLDSASDASGSNMSHRPRPPPISLGFPQHTLPGFNAEIVASQRMQTGSFHIYLK